MKYLSWVSASGGISGRFAVSLWRRFRSLFRRKPLSAEDLQRLWQRQQNIEALSQARHDALMRQFKSGLFR